MNAKTTLYNMFSNIVGNTPAPTPALVVPASSMPTPGNIPAPAQVAAVPATPPSPMAPFEDLWKTDPNAPKPTPATPMFNLDPKAMAAAASQIDFRKSISPELAARMKAGGDDGMVAMMEAMNGMTQTVFAHSATATAKIVEEAVKKTEQNFAAKIPGLLKNQNLRSSLQENPALSNPAVVPFVNSLVSQLQVKHPNAPEAELRDMANEYFIGLAKMVAGQVEATDPAKNKAVPKESDFSDWA